MKGLLDQPVTLDGETLGPHNTVTSLNGDFTGLYLVCSSLCRLTAAWMQQKTVRVLAIWHMVTDWMAKGCFQELLTHMSAGCTILRQLVAPISILACIWGHTEGCLNGSKALHSKHFKA